MNDLVVLKNRQPVTTSLQVAINFDKDHKHVLEVIQDKIQSAENPADYLKMFERGTYRDSRGRGQKMYYLTRDGFAFIAMGFTGQKADKFKLQYISAFNEMEDSLKSQFNIPTTLPEALRLAANQAEQIESMKPKAIFADAVASSDTSISIADMAKILHQNGIDIGEKRFFKYLRDNRYLISGIHRSDKNRPQQRYIEQGIFEIKESSYQSPNGNVHTNITTKVTGKGQQYFVKKFLKHNNQLTFV
ncbi:phage regulatory protein/antirepressor Ant [Companilactobacillus allii]|uniref:Phage regulatory protein/antirepressor Ant n=1 Tax=Companilactobacillus allii TaxID=1847728 RepID=A0A1P8Q4V3_9LACO|nr:phage regulatory protein/antirepressor Ant [Companilactobacillus allii]APX72882.1 phage regulatory protein/antirepressor Ant [Companilactobacillus allii]USQ67670.1 phage regulatory protein/antirepressor Ant [Companilactobacillus allii]